MSDKKIGKAKEPKIIPEVIVTTQEDVKKAISENPDMKWFIIQTYSGKDAAAKKSIEERLQTTGASKDVGIIVMSEKKVSEIRNGKVKIVKKKLYPSYLFFLAKSVDPESSFMDETVYSAIQGSANLHGFIGQENAALPKCIRSKIEIKKMIDQLQSDGYIDTSSNFVLNQNVTIKAGHFVGLSGSISYIDYSRNTVKVDVEMLGTITPVELSISSIELSVNSVA